MVQFLNSVSTTTTGPILHSNYTYAVMLIYCHRTICVTIIMNNVIFIALIYEMHYLTPTTPKQTCLDKLTMQCYNRVYKIRNVVAKPLIVSIVALSLEFNVTC